MPSTTPASTSPTSTSPARRRGLIVTLVLVTIAVLVADQLSKAWALRSLTPGERTDLIGELLGFQLVFNPGAALSLATGMTWLLTLVAAVVVVVIVRASRRIGSALWAVALGLLLGGAIGNLVDRMVRDPGVARGHVVDFIAYADFFVGNVADIAIVVAAVLIVLAVLLGIRVDGTREGSSRDVDAADQERVDEDVPDAQQRTEDEAQTGA
ncbi:MAG: signal peptidase II [Brevundimonas sp.]